MFLAVIHMGSDWFHHFIFDESLSLRKFVFMLYSGSYSSMPTIPWFSMFKPLKKIQSGYFMIESMLSEKSPVWAYFKRKIIAQKACSGMGSIFQDNKIWKWPTFKKLNSISGIWLVRVLPSELMRTLISKQSGLC